LKTDFADIEQNENVSVTFDDYIADACIDRIVNNAVKIELNGETVRGILSQKEDA
jgi:hypothetical protein